MRPYGRNGMLMVAVGAAAMVLGADNETAVRALPRPRLRNRGIAVPPEELEQRRELAMAKARVSNNSSLQSQRDADERRQAKARKHMTQVLAGGFGRAAQIEAWDKVFPHWRGVAAVMRRGGPYAPEDRALLGEAQALLRANAGFLAGPWPSFLDRYEGGE